MNTVNQFHINYFSVSNPSSSVVTRAKQLVAGNWAKVKATSVIFHTNYKTEIEALIASEARKSTQINVDLMDANAVEQFADLHFSSYKVVENFINLASLYETLVHMRKAGKIVSNKGAEELAAQIESGINVEEMEAWLS